MSPAGDRGTGGQGPSGMELLGLAVLLAAVFVVPLIVGLVIDGAAHTTPVFLLVGILVGVIGATATVYTRFKRYL
jgi:F0F1-type ATP synthase assembly protein I